MEDKAGWQIATQFGEKETTIINESGLYSLGLSSKFPSAKKFKRWVTSEVLPSIRKHGVYAVDELLNNPDLFPTLQGCRETRQSLPHHKSMMKSAFPNLLGKSNFIFRGHSCPLVGIWFSAPKYQPIKAGLCHSIDRLAVASTLN